MAEPEVKHAARIDLKSELVSLPLIVLAVLGFFFELIVFSHIPFFRDLGPIFYPMRFSLASSLQAGELPLWDSHFALGFPLLANFQSGTFYLPNLVYAVLPFWTAIRLTFVLHFMVAAVGAYALCCLWGSSRFVAVMGSMVFSFSGCIVSLLNLLNHFQTAVWSPWVVLFSEMLFLSGGRSTFLGFVSVGIIQLLAGSPEFYAMTMGLVLLNGLRLIGDGKLRFKRLLLLFLLGQGFVLGLTMCQILPSLELIEQTTRFTAPSYGSSGFWSLHPVSLFNLVFLDKEVDPSSFASFQSFFDLPNPFLMSLYGGILLPFGLSNWFLTEQRTRRFYLAAVFLVSLALATGRHTPLHALMYHYFPLGFLTRFPEKFFFISFCLLIYATLRGLSILLNDSNGRENARYMVGPTVLCMALLVAYVGFRIGAGAALAISLRDVSGLLVSLERQILLLLCTGGLFYLWQKRRLQTRLFHGVLVAVVFVDLYTAHKPYRFLTDQTLISRRPEALELIKDQDTYRLFYVAAPFPLHPVSALFAGAKSPSDQGIFALETLRPNTGRIWGVNYLQDIDALSRRSYSLFLEVANGMAGSDFIRLLGRMNTKYIFSLEELPLDGLTLLARLAKHPSWLYRIEQVTPRAYVVPRAMLEKDPKRAIARLAEREFDPYQAVLLEEPIQLAVKSDFSGRVRIVSYGDLQISLAAVLGDPGILVLTDAFAPGWNAYVNGTRTRVLRANYFFRAVALPAGRHQVLFKYEPDSFRYGVVVTLLSALLLVGVVASRIALFSRPH